MEPPPPQKNPNPNQFPARLAQLPMLMAWHKKMCARFWASIIYNPVSFVLIHTVFSIQSAITRYTKKQGKNNPLSRNKAINRTRYKDYQTLVLSERNFVLITMIKMSRHLMEQVGKHAWTDRNFSREICLEDSASKGALTLQSKPRASKERDGIPFFIWCSYYNVWKMPSLIIAANISAIQKASL